MDVQTRRMLWDYAKKLNRESGTTILLTTHYVEEADYLCDRIAILEQGKILVTDTPEGFKSSLGDSLLSVKLSQGGGELAGLLRGLNWVKEVNQRDGWLELRISSEGTKVPEIVRLSREHGFAISSIKQHKPSLEDAFLHYVGRKLEDKNHE